MAVAALLADAKDVLSPYQPHEASAGGTSRDVDDVVKAIVERYESAVRPVERDR